MQRERTTYTEHQLTDSMLRRLSAITNQTKGAAKGGNSADALERRGLVRWTYKPWTLGNGEVRMMCDRREVTDAGREALAAARREGW